MMNDTTILIVQLKTLHSHLKKWHEWCRKRNKLLYYLNVVKQYF